jgi:malate dehydrogenase
LVVFIGGKARHPGEDRKDLMKANAEIMKIQGQALNEVAKKDVRCVVVANPVNTNCLVLQENADKIPKQNFTCLTRLDQNRAVAQLARKTNIRPEDIKNVVVWGNHSSTIYPDVNNAKLSGKPIREVIMDDDYLDRDFVKDVQKRGDVILEMMKEHPSILSGARALRDHIRDWWQGTEPGQWVSMGVVSDGSYGVPQGLVFSFPCTTKYFRHNIVRNLELDDMSQKRLNAAVQELIGEWKSATHA